MKKQPKYNQGSYFVQATRARLVVNKSRFYSEAYRILENELGKEPKHWVITEIPLTRDELNQRIQERTTGDYANAERNLSSTIEVHEGILNLYKLIGSLNSNSIRAARKGIATLAKAGNPTYAQNQLSNKKLKINAKMKRDAQKIIGAIKKASYQNEEKRQSDIDFANSLVANDNPTGAYLIEFKNTVATHKESLYLMKNMDAVFEGERAFIKTCQQAFEKVGTGVLSPKNLANLYLQLLKSGNLEKMLLGSRNAARITRRLEKPKKPPIVDRIIGAFRKKDEKELRDATAHMIDWENEKSWNERKKWSVATKLANRKLFIPKHLAKYVGKTKKDLGI